MNPLNSDNLSARDICEQRILETAQAVLNNNFDEFVQWFALPYDFETFEVSCRFEDQEELRKSFERVHTHYHRLGVTHLERRCIEAEFYDSQTMKSTHETRVLRGNELLLEPYPTFCVSRLMDGRWRIVKSSYAVVDQPGFVLAVMGDR